MKAIIVAGIVILLGIAGNMGHQDAQDGYRMYEEMVCENHWPNYKQLDISCD